MRVLWVTPQLPHRQRGAGEALEYELLRLAAQRHRIHVISSELGDQDRNDTFVELDVSFERVSWTPAPPPAGRPAHVWQLLTGDSGSAYWRQGDRVEALSEAMRRAQAANDFDLVHVVLGQIAPVMAVATAPRALLLFDNYSRQVRRELRSSSRLRDKLLWGAHLRLIRRWEGEFYQLADRIACVSAPDADDLAETLGRPVEVMPNPIGLPFFAEPTIQRSANVLSIVASLDYRPNVEGVLRFLNEVWPIVERKAPAVTLKITGRSPVDEVRRASIGPRVTLHPDVEDVRPYYWEAAVSLAPMWLGSGLRNKLLHAMACEAPVVATSTAAEGLRAEDGVHLLIADSSEGFAEAILRSLADPNTARARAKRARALVDDFRPEVVGEALERWWESALASRVV